MRHVWKSNVSRIIKKTPILHVLQWVIVMIVKVALILIKALIVLVRMAAFLKILQETT